MGLFRTNKQPTVSPDSLGLDPQWVNTTVQQAELNRATYRPRDFQSIRILELATGVAHICCSTNADVCSSQKLQLFRNIDKAGKADRRAFKGKAIGKARRDYLEAGPAGAGYKIAGAAATDGEIEEVLDHPILNLMSNPNTIWTGLHMDWFRFYMRQMTGNAYEQLIEGEGGLSMRLPLFPQYVIPIPDEENYLIGYRYGRNEAESQELQTQDIAHYKHRPSRFTPYLGEGSLVGVLGEAQLVIDNLMFDLAFTQEGHQPPGILSIDGDAIETQIDTMQAKMDKQMRGILGKMKTFIVKGPSTYSTMNTTPRDLQTIEKMTEVRKMIRTAFGWSESMADSNASTYAAATVGYSEQYLGGTIRPLINMDADELNMIYLDEFDLDPDTYFFAYENPVPRDAKLDEERFRSLTASGILTTNEARRELGYEDSEDENADSLLVNGQPLGAAAVDPLAGMFGGGPVSLGKPQAAEGDKAADDDDADDVDPFPIVLNAMRVRERLEWNESKQCSCGYKAEGGDDILQAALNEFMPEIQDTMEEVISSMQDDVLRAIQAGNAANLTANIEKLQAELVRLMGPIVEQGMAEVMAMGGTELDPDAFNVVPQRAIEFLEQHGVVVAENIADSTINQVQAAVDTGLRNGMTYDEIAELIDDVPAGRARAIARTETQFAIQGGKYEGFKELGVEQTNWRTVPGVRPSHAAIAKRSPVNIGEPYVKAGEVIAGDEFTRDIYMPPAGVNCRCGLEPIL